ncbi:MAG: family 20 glycosylhydrolase [Algisphaera sp.]
MPHPSSEKVLLLPQPRICTWTNDAVSRRVLDHVVSRIDPQAMPHEQGYRLHITSEKGVQIIGHDDAGVFYAQQTLKQMVATNHALLCSVTIEDWPDFKVRGAMLDVSRDRVPTMETLLENIDRLASWKINQIHLYVEHTIAYQGHEAVWKDSSPLTLEEITILDKHCQSLHIDFVPSQNLFGHLHPWLSTEGYKHLAECPDGWKSAWGAQYSGPFSLNPTDPASLDLVSDLVSQLASCCDSKFFNINCDETFDVGQGKSKAACDEKGRATVYLDFLNEICDQVHQHGKTPLFWGDIVLHHPELIDRVPKNAVLLNWGYEANHPYMEQTRKFHEAGVRQYVCPGTSTWRSLTGRHDNAIENLRSAAEAGLKYNAEGYLITDWGDHGHWHPFVFSWPGLAYGAAVSWSYNTNAAHRDTAGWLNTHVFHDATGYFGQALRDLGQLYELDEREDDVATWWFDFLRHTTGELGTGEWKPISPAGAGRVLERLNKIEAMFNQAQPSCKDADLLTREVSWIMRLTRWMADRVHEDSSQKASKSEEWGLNASPEAKASFEKIITDYKALWLERSRPGGLSKSVEKLTQITRKGTGVDPCP